MKNYPFFGVTLSRSVSKNLLSKYWNKINFLKQKNKIVSFSDLHFHIKDFHEKNGGDISTSKVQAIIREFSNDNLQKIKPSGMKGKWIINPTGNQMVKTKRKLINKDIKKIKPPDLMTPLNVYGVGRYFVYVFYNRKDKVCKVGKTKATIQARYNSLKTGMAEVYTHPILIQFSNENLMKNYEKILEYLLKYKGHHKRGEFYSIEINSLHNIIKSVNRILKVKKYVKSKS